jgi:DNA-directed RNA polymerase specialized sigma24 family protein
MAKKSSAEEHATDAEVEDAIRDLADVDTLRLMRVAGFRARMLVGLGLGIGPEDLLQDAIVRTIDGERRWRKRVSFVKHLIETMRSIANHARDELKGNTIAQTSPDRARDRLDGVALTARFVDGIQVAAIHEQFEQIAAKFADDEDVGIVLEYLADGRKGPEIQRELGITEQQFETIMTRLRRGVDRTAGWQP